MDPYRRRAAEEVSATARLAKNPFLPLALGLILVLAALVLPPVWMLIRGSLTLANPDGSSGAWTLEHFTKLFADQTLLTSTANSVLFAASATLVSLLFGGILAWVVERTNAPLKPLAYLTTIVSLGTPYILYVSAWLYLFGRNGPFNDAYRSITGNTDMLFNVFSLWGMVLVEGFLWSPLVFLMLSANFRAANAEMEEAARMSGASVFATIWRISIKLAGPAILAMALFVFIRNLESFDVPVLIGMPGHVRLLTTDIYTSVTQTPPQMGHASAFAVLMLAMVAVLLYFYGRITRHAERYASVTGKGYRPRPFNLGRWRWAAGGLIGFNFVIILLLPLLALVWTSLLPFVRPMRLKFLPLLTTKHFAVVLGSPPFLQLGLNTLIVAAGAATIAVLLTLLAGWLAARRRPGGGVLDQLATMPLVFPGIVLGLAMMELALALPVPIYGTLWLICIAYVVRYMPYGLRYSYAGVLQIHRELEEAAGVAGATVAQRLRFVVAPLLSPAIVSAWLFIFLIASKELSMAILLAGPTSQVMSVAMFEMWTNGQGGELSALGLIWTLLMTIGASLFYLTLRRQGGGAFGH
jgi:iron(III) transport system permease protein